jgi:hypothetical protein
MTTTTLLQQAPFLREQRQFPNDDLRELSNQTDHAYIDIAQKVNARTIGTFATSFQVITGEKWYLTGGNTAQQTLRQIYQFTSAGSVAHGLNFSTITAFTRIYGTIFDGTNYYPLPYVDVVAANNQINVVVTPTNIVITAGGGAPPTIVSGIVVIEWLSIF